MKKGLKICNNGRPGAGNRGKPGGVLLGTLLMSLVFSCFLSGCEEMKKRQKDKKRDFDAIMSEGVEKQRKESQRQSDELRGYLQENKRQQQELRSQMRDLGEQQRRINDQLRSLNRNW